MTVKSLWLILRLNVQQKIHKVRETEKSRKRERQSGRGLSDGGYRHTEYIIVRNSETRFIRMTLVLYIEKISVNIKVQVPISSPLQNKLTDLFVGITQDLRESLVIPVITTVRQSTYRQEGRHLHLCKDCLIQF